MSARDRIWQHLHELFESDDGSLPEFAITQLTPAAVISGYQRLLRGSQVVSSGSTVHDPTRGQDLPWGSVAEPAVAVVQGNLEPFHIVLGGISALETALPDLGVFVFPDQLVLDYRMGPEWTPQRVEALLHLLAELARLAPSAHVKLEEGVPRFWTERFERAWLDAELERGAT